MAKEAANNPGDCRGCEAPARGRGVGRQRDPPGSEAGQCAAGWRIASQGGRLRDGQTAAAPCWSYRDSDDNRHTVSSNNVTDDSPYFLTVSVNSRCLHEYSYVGLTKWLHGSGVCSERRWRDNAEMRRLQLRRHVAGDVGWPEELGEAKPRFRSKQTELLLVAFHSTHFLCK